MLHRWLFSLLIAAALILAVGCGRKADPVWPFDPPPSQHEQSAP